MKSEQHDEERERMERAGRSGDGADDRQLGVHPLVEAIRQEFPITAAQMELQIAFGLRLNESTQLVPIATPGTRFS